MPKTELEQILEILKGLAKTIEKMNSKLEKIEDSLATLARDR